MEQLPSLGEALAVAAAMSWAVAVILFKKSGETMPPLAVNLFKNILALVFMTPTLVLVGEPLFPDEPPAVWALLAASGVLGIAVADSLFFAALDRLGAGLNAIVDTAYAPIMVGLSALVLGERISLADGLGAGLIAAGLLVGGASRPPPGRTRRDVLVGASLGISALVCMGIGVVMIKVELDRLPLLWVVQVRLIAGTLGVAGLVALRRDRGAHWRSLRPGTHWRFVVPGSVFGAYLAMILWLGGMKYTDVSRASLLNQLSTIFIFVLATVFLREPLSRRRVMAVSLAMVGAALVVA